MRGCHSLVLVLGGLYRHRAEESLIRGGSALFFLYKKKKMGVSLSTGVHMCLEEKKI